MSGLNSYKINIYEHIAVENYRKLKENIKLKTFINERILWFEFLSWFAEIPTASRCFS